MKTFSVGSAQILADKVSHDMTVFVKRHVFPELPQANALNWRDIFVLSQTLRYPEGLTPADISANTRLDPATVLRANEKLYKNRLIMILEQARDARSNLVQVTSGGADCLQNLFSVYREKQEKVFARFLPRLAADDIKEIFETCLNVQEHAEKFASLKPTGKIRHDDRTSYSRHAFQESFEEFQRFPEFILQVYCRRISSDYMFFLKSHAMSEMSDQILRKSRELLTLMTLDYFEHDATAMDVVRLLRFDPATATRAVALLSEEGFIAPANGYRDDDRKKPLILSEKGRHSVAEYKSHMIRSSKFANETLGLNRSQKDINKQLGVLALISNRTEIFASVKKGKLG